MIPNIPLPGVATRGLRIANRIRDARRESAIGDLLDQSAKTHRGGEEYQGLHPFSLAFCSLVPRSSRKSINVVLPEISPNGIFAGLRTALEFAFQLRADLDLPLRIISLKHVSSAKEIEIMTEFLVREFSVDRRNFSVMPIERMAGAEVDPDDLWMATHWTTAHPLDVACRTGVLRTERVLYLIQDYEPGFMPWSTSYALAESTYAAGFTHVVNSTPVADYLLSTLAIATPPELVFRPEVDLDRLAAAAAARVQSETVRILFYARPSKPRNLYHIGASSLRIFSRLAAQDGLAISVSSAGERHSRILLAGGNDVHSFGKLPWDSYFGQISRTDVVFSLQLSPHPSHLPLDGVVSGARSVINDVGKSRAGWDSSLSVADPSPDALAKALLEASIRARTTEDFRPHVLTKLGRPLADVVGTVAARFRD